ncbi:hypothetical protein JOC54_004340 [Alkalihalobacillus xiaoxiensis]|uniref:Uncharacterized protein n=1 Tax=Shouchella xiaoxiensis TaxID=766895 RepID=A0ABS2SZT0_9BACI|nr:hypothetical protein [Shouchella xiaoxiensis]MBM7841041.1 hypothetical protein [Shouchella xiaoxiensis]
MNDEKKKNKDESGEEKVKRQFDEALEQGTAEDDKKKEQEKSDK